MSVIDDVKHLEGRRIAAQVELDMETLDAIFADDLVHVHATGVVQDKETLLQHILSRRQFVAIERPDLTVRVYGKTAILTGGLINTLQPPGQERRQMKGFATQVARLEDGTWRFVSFHACLQPG